MRFLNPKTDFAFKKIFGSEQSRDVLLSFLNAILELEHPHLLVEAEIIDPYLAPKIQGMKDTFLDVRTRDEQGRYYIVEMQVLNVSGFEKRVLYNACKAYSGQISKGDAYTRLNEVIAITITDFVMFEDTSDVISAFKLRGVDGQIYSDDLVLLFAELPKFTKSEEELNTVQDKWFYFLKYAGDLQAVPKSLQGEAVIARAFDIANKAGLSPEELEAQERREIFIQDQRGAIELAEQKAKEVGRKEGRESERFRIARQMISLTEDDSLIARSTGLTEEQVRRLRES